MENNFKKFAIASMVLGIVSICLSFLGWLSFVGIVCGILAIVFSRKYTTSTPEKNGMATAGFVTGIVGGTLSLILAIVFIFAFIALKNTVNTATDRFGDILNEAREKLEEIDTEEVKGQLNDALEEAKESLQELDTEEITNSLGDALDTLKDKLQSTNTEE